MTRTPQSLLQPRKLARQARAVATVDAIQEAAAQVLLRGRPADVTMNRVAERAGVSIGTIYQYYANREALLFAVVEAEVRRLMDGMIVAAEELRGHSVEAIASGLAERWIALKGSDVEASRALYAMSGEFDLGTMMHQTLEEMTKIIEGALSSATDRQSPDFRNMAGTLAALLMGTVRVILESSDPAGKLAKVREELPRLCGSYVAMANSP